MTNSGKQQRARNVVRKLTRIYALKGQDEFGNLESSLCTQIKNPHKQQIFKRILNNISDAERVVNDIELKHGITCGDNLVKERLRHENQLVWLLDYTNDELIEWANKKVDVIMSYGIDKSYVAQRLGCLVCEDCNVRGIHIKNDIIEPFIIKKVLCSQYKNILITSLIHCTIGYDAF